jgi:branched-subunit amino acid ABC-type transport system permease component
MVSGASIGAGVVTGASLGLVAVGFTVVYRGTKVINFASGAQMLLGGYIGWELSTQSHLPYLLTMIICVLAGGVSGLIAEWVGVAVVRQSSQLVQVINLFAVSEAASALYLTLWGPATENMRGYAGATPVIGGIAWSAMDIILLAVTLAVVFGLAAFLRFTNFGLAMRAMASNPSGATAVGLNPRLMSGAAWFVGGAITSLAGVLIFPTELLDPGLGQTYLFDAFAAVALGGLGSLPGGLLGGLILGVAQAVVGSTLGGNYTDFVSVVVLGVVILARPSGLLGASA